MFAWRNAISLLMFNSISHLFAVHSLEKKFCISAHPCMILYILHILIYFVSVVYYLAELNNYCLFFLLLKYMYLATCTLQFLTKHLLSSTIPDLTDYIRCSFTEEHISNLVAVVKDLDKLSITRMENHVDMDRLCLAVDQTVHLLLVSDSLSSSQQVCYAFFIFLGSLYLSIIIRLFFCCRGCVLLHFKA